jgi:hypothetical protein
LEPKQNACFHFGVHDHPIAKGECRETLKVVKNLIINEVKRSPNAKSFVIQLTTSKEFLLEHLITKHNDPILLLGASMTFVMEKISILNSFNVYYIICNFHNVSRRHGYIDNILELKRKKNTIIFKKVCSLSKGHPRCAFSSCQHSGLQVVLTW